MKSTSVISTLFLTLSLVSGRRKCRLRHLTGAAKVGHYQGCYTQKFGGKNVLIHHHRGAVTLETCESHATVNHATYFGLHDHTQGDDTKALCFYGDNDLKSISTSIDCSVNANGVHFGSDKTIAIYAAPLHTVEEDGKVVRCSGDTKSVYKIMGDKRHLFSGENWKELVSLDTKAGKNDWDEKVIGNVNCAELTDGEVIQRPTNYLGCYKHRKSDSDRLIQHDHGHVETRSKCENIAKQNYAAYYGLHKSRCYSGDGKLSDKNDDDQNCPLQSNGERWGEGDDISVFSTPSSQDALQDGSVIRCLKDPGSYYKYTSDGKNTFRQLYSGHFKDQDLKRDIGSGKEQWNQKVIFNVNCGAIPRHPNLRLQYQGCYTLKTTDDSTKRLNHLHVASGITNRNTCEKAAQREKHYFYGLIKTDTGVQCYSGNKIKSVDGSTANPSGTCEAPNTHGELFGKDHNIAIYETQGVIRLITCGNGEHHYKLLKRVKYMYGGPLKADLIQTDTGFQESEWAENTIKIDDCEGFKRGPNVRLQYQGCYSEQLEHKHTGKMVRRTCEKTAQDKKHKFYALHGLDDKTATCSSGNNIKGATSTGCTSTKDGKELVHNGEFFGSTGYAVYQSQK